MPPRVLPHHRRKPKVIEAHHLHQNLTQIYNNFNVTAVYNRPIDTPILSHALHGLILKYPILSCNIFRDDGTSPSDDAKMNYRNFTVRPVETILFDDVVQWGEVSAINGDFLEEMESVKIPINSDSLPLWRIRVNQCGGLQYVTVLCEHTTFDANAAVSFHRDLLAELASLTTTCHTVRYVIFNYECQSGQLPALVVESKALKRLYKPGMRQSMAAVCRLAGPKWLIKFVESYVVSNHPNLYRHPRFSHDIGSIVAPRTKYCLIKLGSVQTSLVLSKCRYYGFTLTPLLHAVAISALQESVFAQINPRVQFSTVASIVIDGRRFLRPGMADKLKYENVVGCFLPTLGPQPPMYEDSDKPRISGQFLDSIGKLSKTLRQNLKSSSSCSMIGLLRLVNIARYVQASQISNDKVTLEVSNLGLASGDGEWHMVDLIFSQSIGYALNFGLSIASTKEGGMNIVVGYNDRFDELGGGNPVDEFSSLFEERLLEFAQTEPL